MEQVRAFSCLARNPRRLQRPLRRRPGGAVSAAGTFVATRWLEADEAVPLYPMPGHCFAELACHTTANEVRHPKSFGPDEYEQLADDALFVHPPKGLPKAE